jgi:hypothetical protein
MAYPIVFFIPGFFILVVSLLNYPNPWIQACAGLGCCVAYGLQSWRLMGVCVTAGVGAGIVVGVPHDLLYAPVMLAGWGLLSVAMAARCPRCRYTIAPSRGRWQRFPRHGWCPMCGRSRSGVWPGQYLTQREAWDGEYHDEGGGVGQPNALVTWWRYVLYQRYLRRQAAVKAGG